METIVKEIVEENMAKEFKEEDILENLKSLLVKEKTLSYLSKTLNKTELEIIGYVRKLNEKGVNITYSEKDGEAFVVRNDHPDLAKENVYRIEEDLDTNTKIGIISDLRFGSKCEQVAVLNDMYRKFAEAGVKYVIVAGNLIEGVYSKKDALEFGESLITNDAKGQADHLIEYFPKVEGIKTLFITGKNEHRSSKKLNIGEYIESQRDDMVYLGPKSCTVFFNNVSFRVEQLKRGSKAYTVAYPPQQYSRSMPSYEDYDAILLSGTQSEQQFPQIRDTQIFAIPSVAERTPKMKDDYEQNVVGSLTLDVTYTKTGKLKRLVPEFSPYYVPSKENYLTTPKLIMKKDEEDNLVNVKENAKNAHAYFTVVDKVYKLMKKEESFNSLKDRLQISSEELFGIITILQEYEREVEIIDINNELVVRKFFQKRKHSEVKPPKEELTKKEILLVSDTHIGSIYSQPSMTATAVYEAHNRGIEDIFHIGDITDGDYSRIRPKHVSEVYSYGASGQLSEANRLLPKYNGMKWHAIQGSHDETHFFNYGVCIGEGLEKLRNDFEYLGQDKATYNFDKCIFEIFHPGGGTSRILSTKPQNGIDQMPSNTKPNISARGHYHKCYYFLYRNIHSFLVPCNVDTSSFMLKQEIPNLMGDLFITMWYDENGDIHYIKPEWMIFDPSDIRERDYENPKRCLKHKLITPR